MEPGDLGAVPDAHPGSHGELPFQQRLELILRLAVERGVSGGEAAAARTSARGR